MSLPIVIYTDHIINKTVCYNFAKGSKSLMCHINNFKEYNKTIATYGVLRGTGELLKKVNNFFYIDHGYFKQSKRIFANKRTNIMDLDGYFRIVYNNYIHDGSGNYPKDRLEKLNLKFRKKNKATDVLSFPTKIINKKKIYVGDIAICFEIIKERSKKTNFFLEFDKMWIHGYLHLIGYDHKKNDDFKKMVKKEKLILKYVH